MQCCLIRLFLYLQWSSIFNSTEQLNGRFSYTTTLDKKKCTNLSSQVFTISMCLFFIEQQSALFSKKLLAVAVSILIFAYLHRFILDTKQDLFLQKILFHNEKVEQ